MSRKDLLSMMRLLSALESWGFSTQHRLPDYLQDELCRMVSLLEAEILEGAK